MALVIPDSNEDINPDNLINEIEFSLVSDKLDRLKVEFDQLLRLIELDHIGNPGVKYAISFMIYVLWNELANLSDTKLSCANYLLLGELFGKSIKVVQNNIDRIEGSRIFNNYPEDKKASRNIRNLTYIRIRMESYYESLHMGIILKKYPLVLLCEDLLNQLSIYFNTSAQRELLRRLRSMVKYMREIES